MAAWDVIGSILKGTVGEVGAFFTRRMEVKAQTHIKELELEQAIHERKLDLIKQGLVADEQWEALQISNSGWKDEWILILLSVPLIFVFVPATTGYVLAGFLALEQTPDWYRWLIMLIFTAIYGIRIWRRQKEA
jgi:hypothetical protein